MDFFKNIVKEIRIKQWVKNFLIFFPMFFGLKLFDTSLYLNLFLGFLSFSFIASCVYIINDIVDIEKDKMHPKKKNRPIASGKMSIKFAVFVAILLFLISFLIGLKIGTYFVGIIFFYFVLNLLYSLFLKHEVIIDIILISFMYYIRILVGSVIIGIEPSVWIFLMTFFGAMFLISAKRYAELVSNNLEKRKVIQYYDKFLLYVIFSVSIMMTLISYVLYVIEKGSILYLSIILLLYILLRYTYLVIVENKGEEPEIVLLTDYKIIVSSLILGITFFIFLYF